MDLDADVLQVVERLRSLPIRLSPPAPGDVDRTLRSWLAEIDRALSSQLAEVLHDPAFQKLEAAWRGLHYLVHKPEPHQKLKIKVLNISKKDLQMDLEEAVEFDRSRLFMKVYAEEYGSLGGEPYGLLVGDYEFSRTPDDVNMLRLVSAVAAAAHAPFVANAGAGMFGMEWFTELTSPRDLSMIFRGAEYGAWKSFRESEDSRYVALAMPRVLGRLPYGEDFKKVHELNFEEDVSGRDHSKFLLMGAAWAYGANIADAFCKHGWMAATRGVEGGGKVDDLPVYCFPTDDGDVAFKCPCEIAISERREFELSNLGFLPLIHAKDRDFAVFFGATSCNKPKISFELEANVTAELSAKINFTLCAARFAHYLKVMSILHHAFGGSRTRSAYEESLNRWISSYCLPNPEDHDEAARTARPLRDAKINVRPVPGKPGHWEAVVWLRPHYQLEALNASMRLVAELPGPAFLD